MVVRQYRGAALLALCASTFFGKAIRAQDAWSRADSATLRLPPAAFIGLPTDIRIDLERRGCFVPQSAEVAEPHNVTRGAFTGAGKEDIAVLCSIAGTSRILVYRKDGAPAVDSLGLAADRDLLQTMGEDRIVYSRRIRAAEPASIRKLLDRHNSSPPVECLDHDGIEDMFEGKASVVLYFHSGRWHRLHGAD